MNRYDPTDFEWRVIELLLPNKPRGVPRVERNPIERFFSKLKHFRRVATRHDKLATNYIAMVQLASMRLWLRAYEPTP